MVKKENDKRSWFTKMFLSKGEVDNAGNPIDDDYLAEQKKLKEARLADQENKDLIGERPTTIQVLGFMFGIFVLMWIVEITFNFSNYLNGFLLFVNGNEDILIISSVILIALLGLGSIFYFAGSAIAIIIVFLIPVFLFLFISSVTALEKIQYILVIGIIIISGLLYRILDKLK
jgi:hypothetical protein